MKKASGVSPRERELKAERKKSREAATNLQKLQKKVDQNLAAIEQERKRRKALESLPPDVILQARKMQAGKKFHRQVVKRTPRDLHMDMLELACGHTISVLAFVESVPQACNECIERWLLRHAPKEKGRLK
jgi:hypothetical protein